MAPTLLFTQTPSNEQAQRYKVLKTFQFVKHIPTVLLFDVEISKHDRMINPLLQNISLSPCFQNYDKQFGDINTGERTRLKQNALTQVKVKVKVSPTTGRRDGPRGSG